MIGKYVCKVEELDCHKEKIISELKIRNPGNINFYYGRCHRKQAKKMAKKKDKNNRELLKGLRKANGYFYYEAGVSTTSVFIFNKTIGTLAHELCHVSQFERGEALFKENNYYNLEGANHRLEKEADEFACNYLGKIGHNKEQEKYRKQIIKRRKKA